MWRKVRWWVLLGMVLEAGCGGSRTIWRPPEKPGRLQVKIQSLEVARQKINSGDYLLFSARVETLRVRVRVQADSIRVTEARKFAPDRQWRFPTSQTPVVLTLEIQVQKDGKEFVDLAKTIQLEGISEEFEYEIPIQPGEIQVLCRAAPAAQKARVETVPIGVHFTQLYEESNQATRMFAAVYLYPYQWNIEEGRAGECYPLPEPRAEGAYDALELQNKQRRRITQVCIPLDQSETWAETRGYVVARYRGKEVRKFWQSSCWVLPPDTCPKPRIWVRMEHLFMKEGGDTLWYQVPYALRNGVYHFSVFQGVPLRARAGVDSPWQMVSRLPDLLEGVSDPETLRFTARCRFQQTTLRVVLQPDSVIDLDPLAYRPLPPGAFPLQVSEGGSVVLQAVRPVNVRVGGDWYLLEQGRRDRLVLGPGHYTVRFYRADRR